MPTAPGQSPTEWPRIGAVAGASGADAFTFYVEPFKVRVGDLVAVPTEVPSGDYTRTTRVVAWGRVSKMLRGSRSVLPPELAVELAAGSMSLADLGLVSGGEFVRAKAATPGAAGGKGAAGLYPLTYPLRPGAAVRHPPAAAIQALLGHTVSGLTLLRLGTLATRPDVSVSLAAERIVARHLAVIAMTGGGKTVAVRRVLRELAALRYPIVVLDPHGDYLGLGGQRRTLSEAKVRVFFPQITVSTENREIVETLIERVTEELTAAQGEVVDWLVRLKPRNRHPIVGYLDALVDRCERGAAGYEEGTPRAANHRTWAVVRRSLKTVRSRLERMEVLNARLRDVLRGVAFEPLPDPFQRPDAIVRPGQLSVLYLGGYDSLTQSTLVSLLLERLFAHRVDLAQRIPPFLTVVEEAHNLVPSSQEQGGTTPSLLTIRRLLTEGRKFGVGVILVTQRPSRVDATALAQCNSFLVMRLVNPQDQAFVGRVMEDLPQSDLRLLSTFGPGQGVIGGQAVRFPLVVQVGFDPDLVARSVADEDFVRQAREWKPNGADGLPAGEPATASRSRRRVPK